MNLKIFFQITKILMTSEKTKKYDFFVTPVKAGISYFKRLTTDPGPGFHRGDDFLQALQI